MNGKKAALYSEYIIDGIRCPVSPARMLDEVLVPRKTASVEEAGYEPVVDETPDPSPGVSEFDPARLDEYLARTRELAAVPRDCPPVFAEPFTKSRIAKALLDTVWMKGRFRLGDLTLAARWKWNTGKLGSMAAFYASAQATAEFIEGLGIGLAGYSFTESAAGNRVSFKVAAAMRQEEDVPIEDPEADIELEGASPFGSEHPVIGRRRACPDKLAADPGSWIIYVPFDTCKYRLGGSLLAAAEGSEGNVFPEIADGDYFMDCYELVRELVEDGILLSGATVGDGGLVTALDAMCTPETGAEIDISGIQQACKEDKQLRVLFGEVPGVLLQIHDGDYDYFDAEFLLQDVAYYPVGHPRRGGGGVSVRADGNPGISDILLSLLGSQASEGED